MRKAYVAGPPPPVDQPGLASMPLLKSKIFIGGDGGDDGEGVGDGGFGGGGGAAGGDGVGGHAFAPFE